MYSSLSSRLSDDKERDHDKRLLENAEGSNEGTGNIKEQQMQEKWQTER